MSGWREWDLGCEDGGVGAVENTLHMTGPSAAVDSSSGRSRNSRCSCFAPAPGSDGEPLTSSAGLVTYPHSLADVSERVPRSATYPVSCQDTHPNRAAPHPSVKPRIVYSCPTRIPRG